MIRSNSQYKKAKEKLKEFDSLIEKEISLLKDEGRHPVEIEMSANLMSAQRDKLSLEAAEYEELLNCKEIAISSMREFPKAIVKARIKAGYTQGDLAKKIEIAEQQIQRYEIQDYNKANLERVVQIVDALDMNVSIILKPQTEARVIHLKPTIISQEKLDQKKDEISKEGLLMSIGE
ncbi:helix-turn-helix transcriptional regulator [uncultured Draconibacterium sp.]|uniref:helix-turn-helix domain-containing protein n=1 Tax=uncultured Draconibacterium sp. TaxID=1573823 RepID=UPI0029C65251|nr:helix-turn-helix transcriptional regulator [uncultured Draconibacterium sp.]